MGSQLGCGTRPCRVAGWVTVPGAAFPGDPVSTRLFTAELETAFTTTPTLGQGGHPSFG